VREFAKLDKDMGTYYLREESDEEGNVLKQSGMLQYLDDLGFVHHMLNMTSTVTTRLSSNRPNFQNLPRGDTSDVKQMFISRFEAELIERLQCSMNGSTWIEEYKKQDVRGVIIELDYSALEVVTMAAFTKDEQLIKALLEGIDMHCLRLSKKLGEPYEEVLRKAKLDEDDPEHEKYASMRTDIKPPSFAYQYGATARGIAFSCGYTIEAAQEFIDNEKELFPGVEAWFDNVIFPSVESNLTRHREEVDGHWRSFCTGTWQSPGGTTYEFRQYPKRQWIDGKLQELMLFKPTQMRNYPIQGESGFFVQGISGLVFRALLKEDFFPDKYGDPQVYIINTVHDALYLDCRLEVLDEVIALVKGIMESLPQHFSERYGYELDVPFPAAAEYGFSMKQKIGWKPGELHLDKLAEHKLELLEIIRNVKT